MLLPTLKKMEQAPTVTAPMIVPVGNNNWATGLMDCSKDEESCWWSCWCCCVVYGRTAEQFGLGKSTEQVFRFVLFICTVVFIFLIGLGPLALLILLVGLMPFGCIRAQFRTEIRQQRGIGGSFWWDYYLHSRCSCCAVSQESREALAANKPFLDYCSGQPLTQLGTFTTEEDTTANTLTLQTANFTHLYSLLSTTSQMLVKGWAVFLFVVVVLMAFTRPLNIIVLLLIFIQPALVMYFFYWRTRRAYASLDLVIKLFTVGFFMATTQSVFFEVILEAMLNILVAITYAVIAGDSGSGGSSSFIGQGALKLSSLVSRIQNVPLARMTSQLSAISTLMMTTSEESESDDGDDRAMLRRYFPLVILYCAVMAFV